jgi:hypothetical protein
MAELVQETVILEAVSQYGATGILTLDSATKTELIRAHFGRPAETILDLDFSRNGNARPNLGDGWSHAEERYTWGKDDNSIITFAAPSNLGPYLLRIRFGTFLTPMITGQLLDVYANEKFIGGFVADNLRPEFRELELQPDAFEGSKISTLRLHHPHAGRPCEHGGNAKDERRLAFAFYRLTIVRPLSEE